MAGARRHMDRAPALTDETDLQRGRASMILSLSELSLKEGRVDAAAELAEQSLRMAEKMSEGATAAEAHMWLGRVADQRGDDEAVDREFEMALTGLSANGMTERLLRCHGMYAEILERRGDLKTAEAHLKKALSARSPAPPLEKRHPHPARTPTPPPRWPGNPPPHHLTSAPPLTQTLP